MMTIAQWLRANPGNDLETCAEALGVSVLSVERKVYRMRELGEEVTVSTRADRGMRRPDKLPKDKPAPAEKSTPTRITASDRLKEFREKYDKAYIIPTKVRQVITDWLSLNSVVWAEDVDMQKKCGINNPADWKTFARENADFHQYQVSGRGGKVIWCRAADRDKLQEMVLLR